MKKAITQYIQEKNIVKIFCNRMRAFSQGWNRKYVREWYQVEKWGSKCKESEERKRAVAANELWPHWGGTAFDVTTQFISLGKERFVIPRALFGKVFVTKSFGSMCTIKVWLVLSGIDQKSLGIFADFKTKKVILSCRYDLGKRC